MSEWSIQLKSRPNAAGTQQRTEQEPWHNKVSKGDVVPRGVVDVRVGLADLIDKDHDSDGDAADNVEGDQAKMLRWSPHGASSSSRRIWSE